MVGFSQATKNRTKAIIETGLDRPSSRLFYTSNLPLRKGLVPIRINFIIRLWKSL